MIWAVLPPQLSNDKARKEFELVLINRPLVSAKMVQFREKIGVSLSREQSDVLALALELPDGDRLSLTDIRGLGVSTTLQAKQIADELVRQQLLQPVGDALYEARDTWRERFSSMSGRTTLKAPPMSPLKSPPLQVTPQVRALVKAVSGEMTRQELMDALGLQTESTLVRPTYSLLWRQGFLR